MIKKIYAMAVILFILAAVFVKDEPDFTQYPEVEVTYKNFTAEKMEDFMGTDEDRDFYLVTDERSMVFDKYTANTRCEIICRMKPDETGRMQLVKLESVVFNGGGSGFEWDEIILSKDVNSLFGYVHLMGQFVKKVPVKQIPILDVLPGMFIRNFQMTQTRFLRTDTVDIPIRLYADQIIEMATT